MYSSYKFFLPNFRKTINSFATYISIMYLGITINKLLTQIYLYPYQEMCKGRSNHPLVNKFQISSNLYI